MREVAVTEGDKVEAQARFGFAVNGYGIGELAARVADVDDAAAERLCDEYDATYEMAPGLRPGGERRDALKEAARIELGPARVPRGRWLRRVHRHVRGPRRAASASRHRSPAAHGRGLRLRRRGRLEDGRARAHREGHVRRPRGWRRRSWRTTRTTSARRARWSSGPTCSRSARASAPGRRAARSTRCRSAAARTRSASCSPPDRGRRSSWVSATWVTVFASSRTRSTPSSRRTTCPKLPTARALWRPRPDFTTAAEAWLLAGGPHHTCYSQAIGVEAIEDLAEIVGVELLTIDASTEIRSFRDALRWNRVYWHLAGARLRRPHADRADRDGRRPDLPRQRRGRAAPASAS